MSKGMDGISALLDLSRSPGSGPVSKPDGLKLKTILFVAES